MTLNQSISTPPFPSLLGIIIIQDHHPSKQLVETIRTPTPQNAPFVTASNNVSESKMCEQHFKAYCTAIGLLFTNFDFLKSDLKCFSRHFTIYFSHINWFPMLVKTQGAGCGDPNIKLSVMIR